MNFGDIVIDVNGKSWLIYEFLSYDCENLLAVTDSATETLNEILRRDDVAQLIKKPKNVASLFIKRRDKNMEVALKGYLK